MKKERIVVLCLCVMLSGSLHTQWIAWAWRHALPSPTQAVWSLGTRTQPATVNQKHHLPVPSNLAAALVCSAWPPLGILYGEALVMGKRLAPSEERHTPEQNPSLTLRYAGFRR